MLKRFFTNKKIWSLFWMWIGIVVFAGTIFQLLYWGFPPKTNKFLFVFFRLIYMPITAYDRYKDYRKAKSEEQMKLSTENMVDNKTEEIRQTGHIQ